MLEKIKVLTFKPPVAHLIVNGLLTQVKHWHGDYRRLHLDSPKIDLTTVAIKASRYWMQPYEVDADLLSLLNSIGITDTVNLPYGAIVGLVDTVSIEHCGSQKYLWTFTNPREVLSPVSDSHRAEEKHPYLEGEKLSKVVDSLRNQPPVALEILSTPPETVSVEAKSFRVFDLRFATLFEKTIEDILDGNQVVEVPFRLPSEYLNQFGWVVLYEDPKRFGDRSKSGRYVGRGILVGAAKVAKFHKIISGYLGNPAWQWHIDTFISFSEAKQIYSRIYRNEWEISTLKSESERADVSEFLLREMANIGLVE